MAINIVALTGRIVRDPEVKKTNSGVSFSNFSIAVERPYRAGEEKQTDFIDCVAWRHSADFFGKYFKKGDMIGVSGRLQVRTWETDDGQRRKSVEVVAENLSFVGGGKRNADTKEEDNSFDALPDDGDLPF